MGNTSLTGWISDRVTGREVLNIEDELSSNTAVDPKRAKLKIYYSGEVDGSAAFVTYRNPRLAELKLRLFGLGDAKNFQAVKTTSRANLKKTLSKGHNAKLVDALFERQKDTLSLGNIHALRLALSDEKGLIEEADHNSTDLHDDDMLDDNIPSIEDYDNTDEEEYIVDASDEDVGEFNFDEFIDDMRNNKSITEDSITALQEELRISYKNFYQESLDEILDSLNNDGYDSNDIEGLKDYLLNIPENRTLAEINEAVSLFKKQNKEKIINLARTGLISSGYNEDKINDFLDGVVQSDVISPSDIKDEISRFTNKIKFDELINARDRLKLTYPNGSVSSLIGTLWQKHTVTPLLELLGEIEAFEIKHAPNLGRHPKPTDVQDETLRPRKAGR